MLYPAGSQHLSHFFRDGDPFLRQAVCCRGNSSSESQKDFLQSPNIWKQDLARVLKHSLGRGPGPVGILAALGKTSRMSIFSGAHIRPA
jgi:hypothetical protein